MRSFAAMPECSDVIEHISVSPPRSRALCKTTDYDIPLRAFCESAIRSTIDKTVAESRDIADNVAALDQSQTKLKLKALGKLEPPDGEALLARGLIPSEWKVLPNGRLGLPLAPHRSGREVFLSTDGHTRLCSHGETTAGIFNLKRKSAVERSKYCCTCLNADGLTAGKCLRAPTGWKHPPVSYYDVLVASGAEAVELPGGRQASRVPSGLFELDLFMLPCGNLRCRHGNSETVLLERERGVRVRGKRMKVECYCKRGLKSWRCGRLQTLPTTRLF